jgi:thiamine biosynthesis lipoprotein
MHDAAPGVKYNTLDDTHLQESSTPPSRVICLALEAMRTRFEVVMPLGADEDPSDLRAAGEAGLAEIAAVEAWLSAYRPDSALCAVNAHAASTPVRVEARVMAFLRRARALSVATDGAFDPTVGPLMDVWGLTGDAAGGIPADVEIVGARSLVGIDRNVLLDEQAQTVSLAARGVRLDPGGIGKGFALDRAADLLREMGVRRALLHGGTSTVITFGAPTESPNGWPVAVQHPLQPNAHLATAYLRDSALSVSAVHGKSFWAEGRRFGHVLDPCTGRPVEKTLLAAVIAPSATETDALSTALLVLGASGIGRLRERFPQASFLAVEEDGAMPEGLRVVTTGGPWNTMGGSSAGRVVSGEPEEQTAQPRE